MAGKPDLLVHDGPVLRDWSPPARLPYFLPGPTMSQWGKLSEARHTTEGAMSEQRAVGLLNWDAARKYVGMRRGLKAGEDPFYQLATSGQLPYVSVPGVIPKELRFRVEDLDRYLYKSTNRKWTPATRYGALAEIGTGEAAVYLDLPAYKLRRLVRKGIIPATKGRKHVRFRVEELDRCVRRWRKRQRLPRIAASRIGGI